MAGDAVKVGRTSAEADQREHVRAAIHERSPEALEERPAAPEHHRALRAKTQLAFVVLLRQRRPSASPSIDKISSGRDSATLTQKRLRMESYSGSGCSSAHDVHGLQSHSTDRARAGADLDDFGMHRACVADIFWLWRGGRGRVLRVGRLFHTCTTWARTEIFRVRCESARRIAASRNDRSCPRVPLCRLTLRGSTIIPQTGSFSFGASGKMGRLDS